MKEISSYSVRHNNKIVFNYLDTAAEAKKKADDWWSEENLELANGAVASDTVEILGVDEDNEILTVEEYEVETEGYHGDYTEHNTHWGRL